MLNCLTMLLALLPLAGDPPPTDAPAPRVVLPDESALVAGPGDGGGRVVVTPDHVPAAAPCTLTFIYTAGPDGIQPGGGIVCLVSAFWGWGPPQIDDPTAPGYVSVACSNPDVRLETELHAPSRAVYARVADTPLPPGATITLIYGDTREGENPRAAGHTDAYAEREERFFFRVDGDGDGFYVPLAQQPRLTVAPRDATRLVCNGPGHAFVDRPLEVSVAALDPRGNRARAFRGDIGLTLSGAAADAPQVVTFTAGHAGAQRVTITPTEAGILLVEVRDPDGRLPAATSNPILVRAPGETRKLYWADLHGHSNRSDGTGTPADYFAYARDVARVDVIALTDHDRWGYAPLRDNPRTWQAILRETAAANQPGSFLTIPGYEWTNWTWGHMHVLFPNERDARLVAWNDEDGQTPTALWDSLRGSGAVTIPHHPGGSTMPFHWGPLDPTMTPVAEICSVHGVSESIDHPRRVTHPVASGMLQTALAKGHRLGLIGSGDTHDGHPGLRPAGGGGGLAGIYARDLTRAAIFEALHARRVYATTGCRAVLRFQLSGHPMGSEVAWPDADKPRDLRISIFGDDALAGIEILRNNQVVATRVCDSAFVNWTWQDDAPAADGTYYYVRARQRDGHWIFSSPIFLERERGGEEATRPGREQGAE